jgi:predicted transcriptional regulator
LLKAAAENHHEERISELQNEVENLKEEMEAMREEVKSLQP